MLENELYLGNTVNMRFSSKSYKDKRKVEHPRAECLVFEGTHPALVTQEVWDIVQRVRQNRRRTTKMNEPLGWWYAQTAEPQWFCTGRTQ